MKLVMTLLVRDEEDILAANLEFHLAAGVDFVVVTDNLSEDRTPEILRRYESAGLVRVIEEGSDDYAQADWVTRMARLAATDHGADWVINNDADEFWWPARGDLRSTLASAPDDIDVVVAHRCNYLPLPGRAGSFAERMVVRDQRSTNPVGEPLGPKVCHRAHPDVIVRQGNHEVEWPGIGDILDDGRIEVLHFPARTPEQFGSKIAKGGAAYERNETLPRETGATWRDLYARQRSGDFDEVVDELLPPRELVEARLAEGRYTIDQRLAVRLRELDESR